MSERLVRVSENLVRLGSNKDALSRLICFPEAGGTVRAFQSWSKRLGSIAEVLGVMLPGRMLRMQEPPETDLREIACKVVNDLSTERLLDQPYALFGHSMGGIVAYESARRLDELGLPNPRALAVASAPAPHLMPPTEPVADASEKKLLEHLTDLGMDPEMTKHPRLIAPFLPGIRADFAAAEAYRHDRPMEPPLRIPLLTWAGDQDKVVTVDHVSEWRSYTTDSFQLTVIAAGHSYVEEEPSLLSTITNCLQA